MTSPNSPVYGTRGEGKRDFCMGTDADTNQPCMLERGHIGPCDSLGFTGPQEPEPPANAAPAQSDLVRAADKALELLAKFPLHTNDILTPHTQRCVDQVYNELDAALEAAKAPALSSGAPCRCEHAANEHAEGHGCTHRMEGDGSECECVRYRANQPSAIEYESRAETLESLAPTIGLIEGGALREIARWLRRQTLHSQALQAGAQEPRELLCMKCGKEHPVWYAPNDIWNAVMRQSDGSDRIPFICPTCFAVEATEYGADTFTITVMP